mmetsp:Transcript_16077/g.38595  ORF Transcript_16077/g.38595 Transcript_16077/m.38595 type:complete len:268 (+) Transcript_16077:601-1404(+)
MQSQLGIIIHVNFHRVLAELFAHRTNFLAQGGTEHHHLLLVRSHTENFLDITAHVQRLQDAITLIQHEVFDIIQLESFLPCQSQHTTRGSNHNVRTIILEHVPVCLDSYASIEHGSLYFWQILGEPLILMCNLEGQFTCVAQNQNANLILPRWECVRIQLVQGCQDKHRRLSHATLGLAHNVHTKHSLGDTFMLDFRWVLKTAINNCAETFRLENEVLKTGGVDSYIVTLLRFFALGIGSLLGGDILLFFLFVVVDEILIFFVVRHV